MFEIAEHYFDILKYVDLSRTASAKERKLISSVVTQPYRRWFTRTHMVLRERNS